MKTLALFVIALAIVSIGSGAAPVAAANGNVPCKVNRNVQAVFPQRLLERGVLRGEATLVVEVDATGKIVDQITTSYTHPEFAAEAARVAKMWSYEPCRNNGVPVISVVNLTFHFSVEEMVVYEKTFEALKPEDFSPKTYAYFAHGAASLDKRPKAVSTTGPLYPKEWIQQGRRGAVTVRFFIDEQGRTRVPAVAGGMDEFLASAAVAAIKDWRFEPPTVKGKPVLVYAEQVINFEPPKQTAAN